LVVGIVFGSITYLKISIKLNLFRNAYPELMQTAHVKLSGSLSYLMPGTTYQMKGFMHPLVHLPTP
jgi:hypothetical protein